MINKIILWSIHNRLLVVLAMLALLAAGSYAIKNTAIDAIPDLSDVQVIIKTSYAGQSPQLVEDQVTYPLTSAMLSVPGAETVRGFSFFGDSYVYVIFKDGTDIYWARSRVLEYLNQASSVLPEGVKPELGPDATGVGWVYVYALANKKSEDLKEGEQQHDLAELRSVQDWFLQYELQTVPGVAEVASLGGMVKQYQIQPDVNKLRAYAIPISHLKTAVQQANQEMGASVIEMAEAEYMLRTTGYIKGIADLEQVPLGIIKNGKALTLKDVADIQQVASMRRGIAELNGEGEVVGGIIVMRYGENAQQVIKDVKRKLTELKKGLPPGVEIIPVYDRSRLIESSVDNLLEKLVEEFIVVALVCFLFLGHFRSSLVAVISLPLGILTAFVIMYWQGLNANIMSLGGIAIAIGAMTDGAIVMIENMHKHMNKTPLSDDNRWKIVAKASSEVGPALFFALLIITVSFLPVFSLEAQEGKMFSPLAYTKTYAMAACAALAITVVPVLMGYFIRGKVLPEEKNPINKLLTFSYRPLLSFLLRHAKTVVLLSVVLLLLTAYPLSKIGSEFIPPLDEGDLMYMPTTYPGISIGKARQLLQQTDKLIRTVPEVENVFGKIGRADTATDPAPLTMIETFIQLKPKDQWREGVDSQSLQRELNKLVSFPGVSNAWVMPIKTRIDMLATGIKTPLGIKIAGPDLQQIEKIGKQIETILTPLEGTASVYSERVSGGRYLNINIDRNKAARFSFSVQQIQQIISLAVGGKMIGQTTEGLQRYPISLRFPQDYRDSPEQLKLLPLINQQGVQIALADVADISISTGPASIKSENARINGWVFIDIAGVDLGSYVELAQQKVQQELQLPTGYSINWSGQYEYLLRVKEKLSYVIPFTLAIIVLLLFLYFRNIAEVMIIMMTLPFALVGSIYLLYFQGYNFSVAVAVGVIALAGVAVEIGMIMLVYLNQHYQELFDRNEKPNEQQLRDAIVQGASLRIRPVIMTAATIIIGLLPLLYADGSGSEIMSRIAAPMIGGMVSALLLSLFIVPVIYYLWRKHQLLKTV